MASSKNFTEVLIGGKVFTLSGFGSEEYLQKVSTYLNHKIDECSSSEDIVSRVQRQEVFCWHLILRMIILKHENRAVHWKVILKQKIKRCMI